MLSKKDLIEGNKVLKSKQITMSNKTLSFEKNLQIIWELNMG